jgi:hypothetical protein
MLINFWEFPILPWQFKYMTSEQVSFQLGISRKE